MIDGKTALRVAFGVALCSLSLGCDEADGGEDSARLELEEALTQTRATDCFSNGEGLFIQNQLNSVAGEPDFVFGLYVDDQCSAPFVQIRTRVSRELGAAIEGIDGAYELDVTRESLHATPFTEDAAGALEAAGCGTTTVGSSMDVSETGCFGFEAIGECGFDFDIAAVVDGVVFGGERNDDMCEPQGRPSQLGTLGFSA
ncbi:MAG: hypothetical protein AAF799_47580 [Myxococcota bacterium]